MSKEKKNSEAPKKTIKKIQEEKKSVSVKEKTSTKQKSKVKQKKSKKLYLDFTARLALSSVITVICLVISIMSFVSSFTYLAEQSTSYRENSFLDYKVYLNPNDFYEVEYLPKDKVYIASLIKNVNVDFNYTFSIEEKVDMKFDYDIVANLEITDESGSNKFYEKEYTLLSKKEEEVKAGEQYSLKENLWIDYNYYNNVANNFRNAYGVETTSRLVVSLRINKQISDEETTRLSDNKAMTLSIPLSSKTININLNYNEINNSSYITKMSEKVVSNYALVALSVLAAFIAIVALSKVFKLISVLYARKTPYDRFITKILTGYDRLIVETETVPVFDEEAIIKIRKFEELVDVRDNLKMPIMYVVIAPHQKSYFYIKHNEDIYLYIVKAVDLETKKES